MKKRNKRGFSLIEILIAGFLVAAVLIPLLSLPLKAFRAELNELKSLELTRESKVALFDAIEALPSQITWKDEEKSFILPEKRGFKRVVHYQVSPYQREERKKVFKKIYLDVELLSSSNKKIRETQHFSFLIHKKGPMSLEVEDFDPI